MNIQTNNILEIAINEVNSVNEKIKGINFLEILKTNLIEKIAPIIDDVNASLDKIEQTENAIKTNTRNITISIKFLSNPSIITKKLIEHDTLFISFNGVSSFDIYENDKNFVNVLLYKNNGISLPKSTTINSKLNKNVLIMEIQNKDNEQILTN
tara:strand:- start:262 stop:723 length:462 start_codon:yes stop_codon:yes gene_type:complete